MRPAPRGRRARAGCQVGGHYERRGQWYECGYRLRPCGGGYFTIPFELIPVYFPGTGDTFSAVLVGRVMAGWSLQRATSDAMRVVVAELIERNADQEDKSAGLPIEACLDVIDHE